MPLSTSRLLSYALCALSACSAANADVGREPKAAPASRASAPPRALSGTEMDVFYDLAKHRAHADTRMGRTLVVDFGSRGDAKYTLGGWGTHVLAGARVDGVSAAFVNGPYGDIILPLGASPHESVRLRLRAPRDGSFIVYLDEKVIARLKGKASEFATYDIDVPEGTPPGEHMLRLRGSGIARLGAHQTAIALDYLAVGPSGEAPQEAPSLGGEGDSLAIPAGVTASFSFKVPNGARFVSELATPGGRLVVRALDDAGKTTALTEAGEGKLDVDLGALSGRVVRLDLLARGAISLVRPRIVAPRAAGQAAQAKPIKNVLVYLIDTLRADHLKTFNAKTRVTTPGLDQLVQKGAAVFDSAHTQENWTKPSVATLLSSLLPWEHQAVTTEAVVPASVELLPERLKKLGFYTGAFIANGYVSDKFGFKQGWDTYRNYIREGRPTRAKFLAGDVVDWLDKRPRDKPFMLYVHAIDPHVPYIPSKEFLSRYDPAPYDGVVNFSRDSTLLEKIKIGKIKLKDRDKEHLEALYDSEISYHDLHFRSILAALEKRALFEDTMIVLVADHGEEFWDHGSVGHGHSVYEELLRIPMIIRLPGVTQATRSVQSSSGLVDIVPTVLDALGAALPEGLSGRSLLPELRGESPDAPPVAVSGFMDGWRTLVIGDLKLIQRTEKRFMVHRLADDPSEQKDVAEQLPITTRYLRGQMGLALAGAEAEVKKRVPKAEKTKIDAQTEAQLKALGYVGSSRR